ncbi:unnamed protein product [Pieris brassicae]|uniref:Uncharacterized protein n=1 Tax=Pieris brassicae TaxID=7116 RepID=A0A9P0TCK7_PIEBR|nr:unnamed protein product [Pieris brassicae]
MSSMVKLSPRSHFNGRYLSLLSVIMKLLNSSEAWSTMVGDIKAKQKQNYIRSLQKVREAIPLRSRLNAKRTPRPSWMRSYWFYPKFERRKKRERSFQVGVAHPSI